MPRRRDIDWTALFASMVETGDGPRAAARRAGLPAGTVLSAVSRERLQPGHGRLAAYRPAAEAEQPSQEG